MNRAPIERTALIVAKICLWAVPFFVLYVPSSLVFPFVTGRHFAFRLLVDCAALAWGALLCVNRAYRPRWTPQVIALTALVLVVSIAAALSPNPLRAFFGDFERMGGLAGLLHYCVYFLLLLHLFRARDWAIFLGIFIAVGSVVALLGLLEKGGVAGLPYPVGGVRVYSTMGNASYLASYLLFLVWPTVILLVHFRRNVVYAAGLSVLLIAYLATIYFTITRSVILGLGIGCVAMLCIGLSFVREKLDRRFIYAVYGLLAAGALLLLGAVVFRDALAASDSVALRRIVDFSRDVSAKDTIGTRFMMWPMALQGIAERPLLGWGQENFYLVFQKYYDPGLFGKEHWFDAAHNAVLDWTLNAGLLGLLAYGAVWWVALRALYRGVHRGAINIPQAMCITALLLGYFTYVQFQFGTFNTECAFFALLAWIERATAQDPESRTDAAAGSGSIVSMQAVALLAWGGMAGYYLGAVPLLQAHTLIDANKKMLQSLATGTPRLDEISRDFAWVVQLDQSNASIVREEIAAQLDDVINSPHFSDEEKGRFATLTLDEARAAADGPAPNTKHQLMLSAVLYVLGEPVEARAAEALKTLDRAVEMSPNRQAVYVERARWLWKLRRGDDALQNMLKAWNLDRRFTDLAADLYYVSLVLKRRDVIEEIEREIAWDEWSADSLKRIGIAHQRVGQIEAALSVFERLIRRAPDMAEAYMLSGQLNAQLGHTYEARNFFNRAVQIDPKLYDQVQKHLQNMGNRTQ